MKELFDINCGINIELLNSKQQKGNIDFVARTSENNGVIAKVLLVIGKKHKIQD